MANNTCAKPPELYQGDNTTKDFSFAFQYIKKEDVVVYLWNEDTKKYVPCTDVGTQAGCNLIPSETEYYFKSDVEISFCKAPGLPPEDRADTFANVIIGRSVDLCAMVAYYYPGTSIRAQDLNNNFTQVLLALQDVESRLYRALVELEIEVDQIVGIIKEDDMQDAPYPVWSDETIGTAAADVRYFSTLVQKEIPDPNYHYEVGKTWLQNDVDKTVSIWDGDAWVGVASGGTFTSQPTTIYVDSVNGDDSNDGHRIINPMRTIKAAVAQANTETSAVTTNVVSASYNNLTGVATFTTNAPHKVFAGTELVLSPQIWECDDGQLTFPEPNDPKRFCTKLLTPTSFEVQMEKSSKVHTYVSGGTVTGQDGYLGDGWIISCAAGVFQEIAPIEVKARNLSIVGRTLRSTFIHPTSATETETMFLVDSGFYLTNFTVAGIKASGTRGGSVYDPDPTTGLPEVQGWVAAFRPGCVIRKSPYIQNCTNFADTNIDNDNFDPNNLQGEGGDVTSGPTGGGILCDGSVPAVESPLRSFVVDSFTQIALDGPGILCTNNAYAQLVSFFGTFCFYHAKALNGAQLNLSNCTTDFGAYGLIADGRSTSPVITGTVSGDYPSGNPDTANKVEITVNNLTAASTYKTNQPGGTQVVTIGNQTYMVLSATKVAGGVSTIKLLNPNLANRALDDGLIEAINNGASAEFRLQSYISTGGHTFEFSGSGTDYSSHPDYGGQADESKQVQELGGTGANSAFNGGKVWLSSTDEEGVFKVGDTFQVNQKTGFVTFDPSSVSTILVSDPTPDLGGDLDVNGYKILGDRNGANGNIELETNLTSSVNIKTNVVNIDGDVSATGEVETQGGIKFGDGTVQTTAGGGGVPEAPIDGNQYARQDAGWSVVTGGGDGGTTKADIYGTAKAWGSFASNGTFQEGNNIASVTRKALGDYSVRFTKPMNNADYSLVVGANTASFILVTSYTLTADGFEVATVNTTTDLAFDSPVSFTVHDNEPAEVALTTFGDVINYSGAAAWGEFASDTSILAGQNIDSLTKTATGTYDLNFTVPMPSSHYSVVGSANNRCVGVVESSRTPQRCTIKIRDNDGATDTDFNDSLSVQVQALNALPPKGGTGTDAWGSVQTDGTIDASFNVASVTKVSPGTYDVVFTTPMPTSNYCITTGNSSVNATSSGWQVSNLNKTASGFRLITTSTGSGAIYEAGDFSFTVNATNATLPNTVTQEQIESAINNPGASAWADVEADGTINTGLNTDSVTRTAAGEYDVVFTTPMPSSNYAINVTGLQENRMCYVKTQTVTGFSVGVETLAGAFIDGKFGFTVFATNALPPKGGTGTDAWATCQADTTIDASFNIASVTRTALGKCLVTFTTPMPTANYAVSGSCNYNQSAQTFQTLNKTSTSFEVYTLYRDAAGATKFYNVDFQFSVNATNATLPTSFTEEEIQAVVDLAKSGSANGASAWGHIDGNNTILGGINVASVTGTTVRAVTFTTPMPNGNYSVVATSISSYTGNRIVSQDATGFSYSVINSAGNAEASQPFNFAVFSSNVSLPLTVTQAEIDTFKATAAALPTAATRIATLEDSIPDVSGFINSSYLEQRIGSITVPQLPADLITASELETRIAGIPYPNLTPYALKTELPVVPPSPDLTPYATTTYVETRIAGLPVPTVTQQDIALAATTVDAKFDMLRSAIQESTDFSTLKARLLAVLQ